MRQDREGLNKTAFYHHVTITIVKLGISNVSARHVLPALVGDKAVGQKLTREARASIEI